MTAKRKDSRTPVQATTPESMLIDLLVPLLLTHGVSVNGRPLPNTLAGVVEGLSDTMTFFGEIFAESDGMIGMQIWSMTNFYPDKEPGIIAQIERLNNRPECLDNGAKWLRIAPTKPKAEGFGKKVMLVAKINVVDGNILADDVDAKISFAIQLIRDSWPIP